MVRKLGILVAALSLVVLAACGDSDDDKRQSDVDDSTSASPSSSTSASPSSSDETPSTGPAANLPADITRPTAPQNQANTLASAKEFATYLLPEIHYEFATRDISTLKELVVDWKACRFCTDDEASIQKLTREKEAQIPDELPEADKVFVSDKSNGKFGLTVTFQMPSGKRVSDSGQVIDTLSSTHGTLDVSLLWSAPDDAWRIADYQLIYGG